LMVMGWMLSNCLHTRSWHTTDLSLATWELKGDAFGVVVDLFDLFDLELPGKEHGAWE
jgi:hypothetical protein